MPLEGLTVYQAITNCAKKFYIFTTICLGFVVLTAVVLVPAHNQSTCRGVVRPLAPGTQPFLSEASSFHHSLLLQSNYQILSRREAVKFSPQDGLLLHILDLKFFQCSFCTRMTMLASTLRKCRLFVHLRKKCHSY